MATAKNPQDLGVVLFQLDSATGITYVDRRGLTVPAEVLQSSFTPMTGQIAAQTATHPAGFLDAHSYWVRVSSLAGITIRLLSRYNNDSVSTHGVDTFSDWGVPIQMTEQRTGVTANSFTLTSGLYLLQTASEHTAGLTRWEAKSASIVAEEFVRIVGRSL